jgi:hypothetical protein
MMQLVVIVLISEIFILSCGFSVWLGFKHFKYQRRQKNAAKLIKMTWQNQQHLYGEVLRKRLAALYQVEGELLASMVDAVLEREHQLVRQLSACLVQPEPRQLADLLHFINRHGDVYSQLANKSKA